MDVATAEREFFHALNPLIEPWVRAGCVSPSRWPFGVAVIETVGRRSGESRSNPVMAMLVDNHLIVGTARGERSDWFRNLQASPDVGTGWTASLTTPGRWRLRPMLGRRGLRSCRRRSRKSFTA